MIAKIRHLVVACCLLTALAACTSGGDAMLPGTVWDFRTPLTAQDLGSPGEDRLDFAGELPLEVVFPSGETVLIDSAPVFGFRSGLLSPVESGRALDEIAYDGGSFETPDQLRSITDDFIKRWGDPHERQSGTRLSQVAAAIDADAFQNASEFDVEDLDLWEFVADEQNGNVAILRLSHVEGQPFDISFSLNFRPAET